MARARVTLRPNWLRDSRHSSNLDIPIDELDFDPKLSGISDPSASVPGTIHFPDKEIDRIKEFWNFKIDDIKKEVREKKDDINRLVAVHDDLNKETKALKEELEALHEQASHIGEVVKTIKDGAKNMCLVKVMTEKFIVDVDPEVKTDLLKPGTKVALKHGNLTLHKAFPAQVDPLVTRMMVDVAPTETYDMIGGMDKQIKEVKEVIELPIKHPELFESLGISQPKGVILYGPPGTGKTLLARAIAHHTSCSFIRVAGTELVQKYIGEGARMVRDIFVLARKHAPSIIFMDEIDSVGMARKEGGNSEVQRTMLELLNQLDGFEPTSNIKVIMATNRIDVLDEALLRPGRIDRKIELPPANEEGRLDILRIHSAKMNLTRGINLRAVAEKLKGASGAEAKSVCTEAGMFALRERRSHVTQQDLEMAVAKVMKRGEQKDMSVQRLWK